MKKILITMILMGISLPVMAGQGRTLFYRGTMVGEDGKAISGVFPMTFALYKTRKSRRAIWKESLWVAVDEGGYIVELGKSKGLPSGKPQNFFIGITIKGMGEVLRERFNPTVVTSRDDSGVKLPPVPKHIGKSNASGHTGSVKYADTAGFASEAGHAKTADKLGNMSLDDILNQLKAAQESGGMKIRVGSTRKYGSRIGGNGGTAEYNEQCPEGYVMIGLRGAYGLYIDSTQIICAPIEIK